MKKQRRKDSLIACIGLTPAFFLIIAPFWFSSKVRVAQERTETRFDQRNLAKFARSLLHPPISVESPTFVVKDRTLYYYLGDVLLTDTVPTSITTSVPASSSDPMAIPLRNQLRVELIRQYIASPPNRYLGFLQDALTDAEKIISQQLTEIEVNTSSPERLLDRLDLRSTELTRTIDNAVRRYANERRLNLYRTIRKVLAVTYDITFSSVPAGGLISYVLEFDWRAALDTRAEPPWKVVAQSGSMRMNAGTYRVRIVWPRSQDTGGVHESEYSVDILNDGVLELKPLPKA